MSKLLIIGCGGHARSVADVAQTNESGIQITFVDDNAHRNEMILDYPVQNNMPDSIGALHVAIGNNVSRQKLYEQYAKSVISVISKRATKSISATVKSGAFVAHNCFLGPLSEIGIGTIINTGALIEHEVIIGNFCHIAPNATICGRSQIGNNVTVGAGSVVIDNIKIVNDVLIGANSTVVNNITEPGTYVGSPARKVK